MTTNERTTLGLTGLLRRQIQGEPTTGPATVTQLPEPEPAAGTGQFTLQTPNFSGTITPELSTFRDKYYEFNYS